MGWAVPSMVFASVRHRQEPHGVLDRRGVRGVRTFHDLVRSVRDNVRRQQCDRFSSALDLLRAIWTRLRRNLLPPELLSYLCSRYFHHDHWGSPISLGTSKTRSLRNIAGLFRITLLIA